MKKNSIVRLTNLLNFTRFDFDVLGQRLLILMLEYLKEQQGFNLENTLENIEITFSLSDFRETDPTKLRKLAKNIIRKEISYHNGKTGKDEVWIEMIPFPYAKYENGKFTIDIIGKAKKHFVELAKGFSNLDKGAVFALSSQHSIRMYELLSAFVNKGEWFIRLNELKQLLGIELSQYKNYALFEKRILIYSQKELWEHCGIHFEWAIAQKERKKITALTFTIRTKEKQEKVQVNADIKTTMEYIATLTPKDIAEKSHILMTQYTLSAEQKDYILSDTNVFNEFIRVHAIIENMIDRAKPPKDRTKYLAKSLGLDKVKFAVSN